MCKAVEDYGEKRKLEGKREGNLEGKLEVVKSMLREKISLETALRITGIDEETYNEYAAKERLQ